LFASNRTKTNWQRYQWWETIERIKKKRF
jgi:hypothetical protein